MGHIDVTATPTDSEYGHTDFVFKVGGRNYAAFYAMVWQSASGAEWARDCMPQSGHSHVSVGVFTIVGRKLAWL